MWRALIFFRQLLKHYCSWGVSNLCLNELIQESKHLMVKYFFVSLSSISILNIIMLIIHILSLSSLISDFSSTKLLIPNDSRYCMLFFDFTELLDNSSYNSLTNIDSKFYFSSSSSRLLISSSYYS